MQYEKVYNPYQTTLECKPFTKKEKIQLIKSDRRKLDNTVPVAHKGEGSHEKTITFCFKYFPGKESRVVLRDFDRQQ